MSNAGTNSPLTLGTTHRVGNGAHLEMAQRTVRCVRVGVEKPPGSRRGGRRDARRTKQPHGSGAYKEVARGRTPVEGGDVRKDQVQ